MGMLSLEPKPQNSCFPFFNYLPFLTKTAKHCTDVLILECQFYRSFLGVDPISVQVILSQSVFSRKSQKEG